MAHALVSLPVVYQQESLPVAEEQESLPVGLVLTMWSFKHPVFLKSSKKTVTLLFCNFSGIQDAQHLIAASGNVCFCFDHVMWMYPYLECPLHEYYNIKSAFHIWTWQPQKFNNTQITDWFTSQFTFNHQSHHNSYVKWSQILVTLSKDDWQSSLLMHDISLRFKTLTMSFPLCYPFVYRKKNIHSDCQLCNMDKALAMK